jgi:hypothetical protein
MSYGVDFECSPLCLDGCRGFSLHILFLFNTLGRVVAREIEKILLPHTMI